MSSKRAPRVWEFRGLRLPVPPFNIYHNCKKVGIIDWVSYKNRYECRHCGIHWSVNAVDRWLPPDFEDRFFIYVHPVTEEISLYEVDDGGKRYLASGEPINLGDKVKYRKVDVKKELGV